jgi:FkbM family methyltransferase
MKRILFLVFRRLSRLLAGKGLGLGKVPLLASLHQRLYSRLKPNTVCELSIHGSKMFYDAALKGPLESLVSLGTYESYETDIFQSLLKPGMTVVDIGANVGYYTLLAARAVQADDGRVFSFEPDPRNYAVLARSLHANGYHHVFPVQKAVSDAPGTLTLYADALNSGNSSLEKGNVQSFLESYTVEAVALDDFLEAHAAGRAIDLLKVDVQGAEGHVFRGARRLLESGCPMKIMMEFEPAKLSAMGTHPVELLQKLVDCGFAIRWIDTRTRSLRPASLLEIESISSAEGYTNLLLERAAGKAPALRSESA